MQEVRLDSPRRSTKKAHGNARLHKSIHLWQQKMQKSAKNYTIAGVLSET